MSAFGVIATYLGGFTVTGFTNSMILELARLMKPITLAKTPLAKVPDRKNKIDHWAAPKYWAEVEYRAITSDGLLRHTTFRGLYASRTAKKAARRQIQGLAASLSARRTARQC